MMPGPYNNSVPVPMMHQGRRQQNHPQQQEYYHGYYQQQYQHQYQHNPYAHQQWYAGQYQQPQMAYRPYNQYPPQHAHPNGPMIVSSHPQHQSPVPLPHRPSYSTLAPGSGSAMSIPPVAATPMSTQSFGTTGPSTPSPATTHTPTVVSSSSRTVTPTVIPQTNLQSKVTPEPARRLPFYPSLPWFSVPESEFPPRTRRRKRKLRVHAATNLDMPERVSAHSQEHITASSPKSVSVNPNKVPSLQPEGAHVSHAPTDPITRKDTLPLVVQTNSIQVPLSSPKNQKRTVVPAIPVSTKPVLPKQQQKQIEPEIATSEVSVPETSVVHGDSQELERHAEDKPSATPPAKIVPKSWADLVRTKALANSVAQAAINGTTNDVQTSQTKTSSLGEVIRSFTVAPPAKISFLEPRGLVNTGNMCYMNSILQVLVFCVPFYDFLEQVAKNASHRFKSETPLLDAMILIMREFNIIDAAESVTKLRMRLKDNELEQYGESFIPEYVYDVIKRLPRFSTMRHGHQQDAEEFMGFLLEGLHDECVSVLRTSPTATEDTATESSSIVHTQVDDATGWHEVGPKQRAAITRSSGFSDTESPIAKIFGGKLRSELRVPGLKNSVTMEPYQALQLDIGSPTVHNILDALKGLTRPETLHGDFNSPRGPGTTATKQTFIESLPPVLILHLKRFQYDNTGGVQKIWKKVGYPLELTMPKEAFSPSRRSAIALSGTPKYRLSAVVYHHGKNASGGHYTVDLRRQDGIEWIRLDDTNIRRLRAEDVASLGAEEDPKVLAKALEEHNNDQSKKGGNIFESFADVNEDREDESNWNQVNGSVAKELPAGGRKWAAVANGSPTPSSTGKQTPRWESVKDNKVAYILFYHKME